MSIEFEDIPDFTTHIDIDSLLLKGQENRTPNKLGLYRTVALVIGSSGSGKSTAILSMLLTESIEKYDYYIICLPTESMDSGIYKTLKEKKELPIVWINIDDENLPSISEIQNMNREIAKQMKKETKDFKVAMILDDFISIKKIQPMVKRYLTQLSRASCSLYMLTQTYNNLEPAYRKSANVFILFCATITFRVFTEIMRSYYIHGNFTPEQLKTLYNCFKSEYHEPVILINNEDKNKSMIYKNNYIKFIND